MPFDTHAYVKKLMATGFTEPQAEVKAGALAEIVNEHLASKQDLKGQDQRNEQKWEENRRDLKEMELRLKHDLTLRLGAMQAAGIVIVAALVKLL